MYAIVSITGQQFKVEKNQKIFVHRLQGDPGSVMEFDKVIMIDNEGKVNLGNPYIDSALVTARIISHLKGDKVLIFKKKRKKGYQKLNGHRQYLTEIVIEEILESGAAKKTSTSVKKEKKEEPAKSQPAGERTAKAEEGVVKAGPEKAKEAGKAKPKKAGAKAETGKVESKAEHKTMKGAKKSVKTDTKAKAETGKAKKTEAKTKTTKKKSADKK